jgi:hypothetical protein
MNFLKPRFLAVALFGALSCQLSLADSTCANVGTPVNGIASFTCNFFYNQPTTTFNLLPLMTQNGAPLSLNDFVTGYTVVINGNPSTLADNATGLFNTNLWEAVLFKPGGDPDGPLFSDMLTVYWPGSFPANLANSVQTLNQSVFGALPGFSDRDFFVQATGSETVIGANTPVVLNIFTSPAFNNGPVASATPEPASITLIATGLIGLGGCLRSRFTTGKNRAVS